MGRCQVGFQLHDALFQLLFRRYPIIGSYRDHLVDLQPHRFTGLNDYYISVKGEPKVGRNEGMEWPLATSVHSSSPL
jgi:hypothetical protein